MEDDDTGSRLRISRRPSQANMRKGRHHRRRPSASSIRHADDERASLLDAADLEENYATIPGTPRPRPSRQHSAVSPLVNRAPSFTHRLTKALSVYEGKSREPWADDRVWYDQFTSTDWVHDAQKDAYRVKNLRARRDFRGRMYALFDGAQGWILVAIIGIITACVAFFVDVSENVFFDWKEGYCTKVWYLSKKRCCLSDTVNEFCPMWTKWSVGLTGKESQGVDFAVYILATVALATLSCLLTLTTRTTLPGSLEIQNVDEDLSLHAGQPGPSSSHSGSSKPKPLSYSPPVSYYSAAGSGVAEVKVILSGFVLHGYLGFKTLVVKVFALILSVSSGLSLGKEGPYVHVATCIGNIACRLFDKYNYNDAKRREVLSASAASGVAVAFGAPIGGVLFSLEEVSYYFPPKTLFRTFFCCIVAALSLKFLNPYGTSKIVLFEVRYTIDWHIFELLAFIFLGVCGGTYGALFIKASKHWATRFRRIRFIKANPLAELMLVALVSALVSYWNRYSKMAVSELLYELASPCSGGESAHSNLCPEPEEIPDAIWYLAIAFAIKSFLTVITFGTKVPSGIYVPTMVIGGLMGHMVGLAVEYAVYKYPDSPIFASCPVGEAPSNCVVPGVYALVAAGAVMCGVTRLSVTLAIILFEMTGSLDHVLPFSLAVLVSKWTADAIEPLSIYDLLTDLNSYPFLDNKVRPIFSSHLADITPRPRPERIIDISESPLVPATSLREKLRLLQAAGELDGGLPIVNNGVLVGLIPAPDLEYALDNLNYEDDDLCRMAPIDDGSESDYDGSVKDPCDFTPYIDPAPVALERHSPMDLVYECFVKLGLRYMCVLKDGKFHGVVHKKTFVKYLKEVMEEQHRH
ncbi:chloride channel [Kalaharituber pfeilii]|nr:chloride channel [Kalaharituber pfeilii]